MTISLMDPIDKYYQLGVKLDKATALAEEARIKAIHAAYDSTSKAEMMESQKNLALCTKEWELARQTALEYFNKRKSMMVIEAKTIIGIIDEVTEALVREIVETALMF